MTTSMNQNLQTYQILANDTTNTKIGKNLDNIAILKPKSYNKTKLYGSLLVKNYIT